MAFQTLLAKLGNSTLSMNPPLTLDHFDGRCKWNNRVAMTGSGNIYCPPANRVFVAFSRLIILPQNWIEIFFQNNVIVVCGNHVLPLSMDASTSCQVKLAAS